MDQPQWARVGGGGRHVRLALDPGRGRGSGRGGTPLDFTPCPPDGAGCGHGPALHAGGSTGPVGVAQLREDGVGHRVRRALGRIVDGADDEP
jgi:hypothetical protein